MKKIFIIDDDAAIVEALQLALETEQYKVVVYAKGQNIVKKVKDDQPDLILLDLLIAGIDGRNIANELKGREETHHIPIIMLSAHPSLEDNAKESKVDGFLAKPFDIDILLQTVKTCIRV